MAKVIIDRPLTIAYTQKVSYKHVKKTCGEILIGARRLAPRGSHLSGSGELSPDIPLRADLHSNINVSVNFVTGRVGSSVPWAASVHQGSKPHTIRSKRGLVLRFRWERGRMMLSARGRRRRGGSRRVTKQFWFFEHVRHPGNKRPIRYLTTPMHQFGRANGFITNSLAVTRSRLP